jgi:uncharacterized repeat protein (TIGR03803 family)
MSEVEHAHSQGSSEMSPPVSRKLRELFLDAAEIEEAHDELPKGLAQSSTRRTNKVFLLPVLVVGLRCVLAGQVSGQTLTTLHSFSGYLANAPLGGLVLSSNTLYGATPGQGRYGIVFKVDTGGTGFTVLHSFNYGDGEKPWGGLLLWGTTLYGTTTSGGSGGLGTVFAVNTDGMGFTNLHSFSVTACSCCTNTDGAIPYAGLVLSGTTLYGTTSIGGAGGRGAIFAVSTDGTGFTNLYSFTADSDGGNPVAGLILSGNTLYGTAQNWGASGNGTVFALNTDGTGFRTLHTFTALSSDYANSDGANPRSAMALSGDMLYGTTPNGGEAGNGTVFAINTDGTGFTTVHTFTAQTGWNFYGDQVNGDGAQPYAGLALSGGKLYGTTAWGGAFGGGAVFSLNTNGTGFTTLHSFTARGIYGDGVNPLGPLICSDNTLYGTTDWSGGTVFSISLLPQLTITLAGKNVVLSWPTNYAGFDYTRYRVQSTTNLGSPVWTTNFPVPVSVNGLNTVTNPSSGTQQFFRLSQ